MISSTGVQVCSSSYPGSGLINKYTYIFTVCNINVI